MALETYFYDAQLRRFLTQIIRILSNFQVKYSDGTLLQIPVTYGDSSRQAATIIKRNSENSISSTPLISIYITNIRYDQDRLQSPTFTERLSVRTKKYNSETDSYLPEQGNAYTVERIMPAPYTLTVKADIWTSNTDQKFQILEQVLVLFNPSIEIQSTDNYWDWSSLTTLRLTGTTWSSKSIPAGTEDQIDISTLEFELPVWLSMPAKVTKMGVILKIIAGIFDPRGNLSDFVSSDDLLLGTRPCITFQNYGIFLNNSEVKLVKNNSVNVVLDPTDIQTQIITGDLSSWSACIDKYGAIRNGITQLRMIDQTDPTSEIVGTVAISPTDDTVLLFNVDTHTLPANTLTAITAVIDPTRVAPGINGLPNVILGQRYLLLNSLGNISDSESSVGWNINGHETIANRNDIIEYDGTKFIVVFDSNNISSIQVVTNLISGKQYKFVENEWVKAVDGEYTNLNWRLVI